MKSKEYRYLQNHYNLIFYDFNKFVLRALGLGK